ncbi:carbohydrate ABC transporter permease [Clostridium sp. chh4-2]|uniref:carbohydrate ABC transporter permease n=1 Tax=Clostridium sp. chh4-2 TaxID=2067550 RepID=UPI0015E171DE|nr:carbohydrate ABC transporter permease [Clostridium sp. chh4-2]
MKKEKAVEVSIRRRRKRSAEDWLVDGFAYGIAIILMLSIVLPFMQVITISMSPASIVNKTGFHLIPLKFDFSGYTKIATDDNFWHSYLNTIMRAVVGTASGVLVTLLTAYPLAKTNLPYRKGLMLFVVFTMYFSGGMIPKYLLIKNLHLTNNFLVYILPCLVTGFALIITRNFFMSIPPALEESAKIDGASNLQVLFKIYMPLSTPVMATISLWYCVQHWNSWMDNMLYVTKNSLYVLQYVIQTILVNGQTADMEMMTDVVIHTETMKMAALVLSLIPIVCTYPFLQKYFVKGMIVGSVKG